MTRSQREEIERRLEESSAVATRLFDRHAPAELTRRPAEASWSAAECVVHLTLTSEATVPLVEAAVADLEGRGRRDESPSRMDLVGRLLRWSLEPPPRFRSKTTARFQPLRVEPLADVLSDFRLWQGRIVAVLRRAEGLDLTRAKIASPFSSRIRYNVFSALNILETHERRHLLQAERAVSGAV